MIPRRPIFFLFIFTSLALQCNGKGRLRIINGTTAALGAFPFVVSLQTKGEHFCGGTLVDRDVVVTAAHCLMDVNASDIAVVAGINYLKGGKQSKSQTLGVTSAVQHPCFKWPHLGSDIALLALNGSFAYTKWVTSTHVAPDLYAPTGKGVIAGWGATREGGPNNNGLMQANVNILDPDICSDHYGDEVDSTNICAAPSSGTEDACQGDSGGPLMCSNGYFCGVISGGAGCGAPDFPGVYTNVGCFTTWIVLGKYQYDFDAADKFGETCSENILGGDVILRKMKSIFMKNQN